MSEGKCRMRGRSSVLEVSWMQSWGLQVLLVLTWGWGYFLSRDLPLTPR